MNRKHIVIIISLLVIAAVIIIAANNKRTSPETAPCIEDSIKKESVKLYEIPIDEMKICRGEVADGASLSTILDSYGVSAAMIDRLARQSKEVFDVKKIRGGNSYTTFQRNDSLGTLAYFVYEINTRDYVVYGFENDSITIRTGEKVVTIRRRMDSARIESSLWNAMIERKMSPALTMELSDIFAWSIDFFALQQGDSFKVIYEEEFVDSTLIGTGRIWGAWFEHGGKRYYAIPFEQKERISYWDENGNSLRKNLLKAPLKYSRISSSFSNSRLHPVLRIRRPHHGVDYAAPSGTPVMAVADGVVTSRAYTRGGGNTLKIKHSQGLVSGYLHLRGFARGIVVGSRVSQGDIIGYVGSTGLSTGPHLDFRIWRNGTPIDPLKVPSTPTEPVNKTSFERFTTVRDSVIAVLNNQSSFDILNENMLKSTAPADSTKNQPAQ